LIEGHLEEEGLLWRKGSPARREREACFEPNKWVFFSLLLWSHLWANYSSRLKRRLGFFGIFARAPHLEDYYHFSGYLWVIFGAQGLRIHTSGQYSSHMDYLIKDSGISVIFLDLTAVVSIYFVG